MKLKAMRVSRGMNQSELSNLSGVGVNTILKLEKGNIDGVSVGILKKIANALNITVVELFFKDEFTDNNAKITKQYRDDIYKIESFEGTGFNYDNSQKYTIIQIIPVSKPATAMYEDKCDKKEFFLDIQCLALIEFEDGYRSVVHMATDESGVLFPANDAYEFRKIIVQNRRQW